LHGVVSSDGEPGLATGGLPARGEQQSDACVEPCLVRLRVSFSNPRSLSTRAIPRFVLNVHVLGRRLWVREPAGVTMSGVPMSTTAIWDPRILEGIKENDFLFLTFFTSMTIEYGTIVS
jgi:hypothetical protein